MSACALYPPVAKSRSWMDDASISLSLPLERSPSSLISLFSGLPRFASRIKCTGSYFARRFSRLITRRCASAEVKTSFLLLSLRCFSRSVRSFSRLKCHSMSLTWRRFHLLLENSFRPPWWLA